METAVTVTALVVALFFVIEGIRGLSRSSTLQQFFLLDGGLELPRMVATVAATNFSLGNMIYLCLIWGFLFGLSGTLWLVIGFVIAAVVYVVFVRHSSRVQAYIEDRANVGSVHEYLARAFTPSEGAPFARRIRFAASLSTVLCLVVALTLELYLAAALLAPIVNLDLAVVFFALTVLICLYSAMGGFYAVVLTDVIQGIMLIGAVLAIVYVILSLDLPLASYDTIHPLTFKGILTSPGWTGILSILAVTFGWFLVTMDTWQRACASRSSATATRGIIYGTWIFVAGIIIFTAIGMYDNLALSHSLSEKTAPLFSGGFNPLTDLYLFVDRLSGFGQVLMGFVAVAFVTAGLSTADTFLIVAGHSFVSDVLVGFGKRTTFGELSDRESRFFTGLARGIMVFMGVFVIVLFLVFQRFDFFADPLGLFYLAYSIQFALLAPVGSSLLKRRPTAKAVFWSVLLGVVAAVFWGFGFAALGKTGVSSWWGLTVTEWIYLAPLPPMIVGGLVLGLARLTGSWELAEGERQ